MILESKQTTLAYRCPQCGAGVMSLVGLFSLSSHMMKLKCDCGGSELTAVCGKDGKIRLTVPCIVCPTPPHFTVSKSLFFGKDLFTVPCPYSNINLVVLGEANTVKAELARGELELLDMMEKNGISDLSTLHEEETASLTDPQILDVVMFVIHELDAEGKIYCNCPESDEEREYDVQITEDGILVSCQACGASRLIPTDSCLSAHAFLNADALYLE